MVSTAIAATAIETFASPTISRSRVLPKPDCVPKVVVLRESRAVDWFRRVDIASGPAGVIARCRARRNSKARVKPSDETGH